MPDNSGDGRDELIIGAPPYGTEFFGATFLVFGQDSWPAGDLFSAADLFFEGGGVQVASGDMNGDGGPDVVTSDGETITIWPAPFEVPEEYSEVPITIATPIDYGLGAWTVVQDQLVIVSDCRYSYPDSQNQVRILSYISDDVDLEDEPVTAAGSIWSYYGDSVGFWGDGHLLVGEPGFDGGLYTDVGAVYVY
jgi:hypothetical protein